jgi:HlyD family secretion protein
MGIMRFRYLGILLLLAAAAYGSYLYLNRELPLPVIVATVEQATVESTVANTRAGAVRARNRARLAPAVGGQIASLDVHKGDRVEKGQVLLTLWNDDIRARLQLSHQETAAAEALARQTCLLADFARRDSRRLTELHRRKSSSESLYDKAVTTALAKQTACEAAEIQVTVSQARFKTVQAQLDRTILRAPFSGIVAQVNGEIGEFITPSPTGVATLPAIDLINLNDLYVTAPIDEMDAARIRTNMAVRLSLDAFPGQQFAGTVLRIAPYVLEREKQARTVEVECGFSPENRPENLLVGYSADVEIIIARSEKTLRIPAESLLEGKAVYVLDRATSRIRRQSVRTGLANWKFVEVISGVSVGEQVVSSLARQELTDGLLVQVEDADHSGVR